MTSTNDITGDKLIIKSSTESYRDGWDRIFGKNKQIDPVHCPNCPDQGWYGIVTGGCGPDGENDTRECEQVQCEFCYLTLNSVFNVTNSRN